MSAVRAMHDCGFLHRDIKPSNFAMGGSTRARVCYMFDFGLSRQYTTPTGEVRQPRPVAGFRGTVRYASLNAHCSKDLGRHDDLWSVLYLLVELATGQLPWRKVRDKEEAGKLKARCDHTKLIRGLPIEFHGFLQHVQSLTYFLKPDYALVINLLSKAVKHLGAHISDPFDWEQDYSAPSATASIGSPPALRVEEKRDPSQKDAPANQQKAHPSSDSRTYCSEVVDLNENGVRERPQMLVDLIDEILKEGDPSEKEPVPKTTENSDSKSETTTTTSPSHGKHGAVHKSLEKSEKPELIIINGKLDGLVNRHLTEDGENKDGDSAPSHGHPQPFRPEQHVPVLPTCEHNISNQLHGESSFMRLKNGSLANRNGLTDSLDRFFELQPKQNQEAAAEGDDRGGWEKSNEPQQSKEGAVEGDSCEKSKEPKQKFGDNSPSDLKPLSLTQEISYRGKADVAQIAPVLDPDDAPRLAYGSEHALSSEELRTVDLSFNAVPEQDQIMQQHALRACTSEDSSASAPSPLATNLVDAPQSCNLPEPSSKPSSTQVQPYVAKALTPLSEQHIDTPVEKASPTLPSAHPVKSARVNSLPLSDEAGLGARKCNKPLTLELLPSPPLSELQIHLSTTIHSNPVTPTVTNTSAPISNQRRSLIKLTSGLPAAADQRHNPGMTALNHIPRPPAQPPPPNYASCVSARRRRFSRTPTSGDHLPQKLTDQSPI